MKKLLLLVFAFGFVAQLSAQSCSDLFFSKYLEGYSNNRALEIYNPTSAAIDLSNYSVGRYSNGGLTVESIQLPADMIQPYGTYVVVIDKRDSLGTSFETPVWNGYQLWDTCVDAVTGMPILDSLGNAVFCVQYNSDGLHLYGTEYHDWLDLQGRADVFLCPVYSVNNAMYFNGDDAVVLFSGTSVATDGSNLLDVVGVIGEDPGTTWSTPFGQWITKDKTLVRNANITEGKIAIAALSDTVAYSDWTIYPKNTFTVIDGTHDCACNPTNTTIVKDLGLKVYPNPSADGRINVEAKKTVVSIEVYNLLGQQVYTENFNNVSNTVQVQLSNTQKGIYIMKMNFADNISTTTKIMLD